MLRQELAPALMATLCLGGIGMATPHAPLPTTVPPMFYSEIVQKADVIVAGTVVRSEARYENDGATIRTYVELGDLEFHKGAPRPSLTLRFEGGRIGADELFVAGMPQLQSGKRYFLYVDGTRHPEKLSPIVGFHQGAFEIATRQGRQVLLNMSGQELVGVQNDRFVFRKVELPRSGNQANQAPVAAPVAIAENHEVQHADRNADAIEARELARRLMDEQRLRQEARVEEIPAARRDGPAGDGPPVPVPATPVPPTERDRSLALPLVVDEGADPGFRAAIADLMKAARAVEEERR